MAEKLANPATMPTIGPEELDISGLVHPAGHVCWNSATSRQAPSWAPEPTPKTLADSNEVPDPKAPFEIPAKITAGSAIKKRQTLRWHGRTFDGQKKIVYLRPHPAPRRCELA